MRLGDILVSSGVITEKMRDDALAEQKHDGRRLGALLVELGYISEDNLVAAISKQLDIPVVHPMDINIDRSVLRLVPYRYALEHMVIPVESDDSRVVLAMADPMDVGVSDHVSSQTGLKVEYAVSPESEILQAAHQFYSLAEEEVIVEETEPSAQEAITNEDMLRQLSEHAPAVRLVNAILVEAVDKRATDVHVEPGKRNVAVRIRIDGMLRQIMSVPKALQPALVARLKVMSDLDITERRLPQDGRAALRIRGREVDVRVSSLPCQHGEKIVLRLLDKSTNLFELSNLGCTKETIQILEDFLSRPQGLILVTGPTGSGKTTTLYAMVNRLRREEVNITTVEDPIEYEIPAISQTQVQPHIGLTFATQLRSILRQDPDIILVGEMRDYETAEMGFRAALTGHIVLSTLHTNDAPSALIRLTDIGVEPYLIPSCLTGIVAQRLLRLTCIHCKKPYQPSEAVLTILRPDAPDIDSWKFLKGVGCNNCSQTGYRGRSAIFEILPNSEATAAALFAKAPATEIKEIAISEGMHSLRAEAMTRLKEGHTTAEEVVRVTYF
jgi:type IV pilus assembly protein PilB